MATPSDDELMERVKRSDHAAFVELFDRHSSAVYGYCMRTFAGNRPLTEDVSQEVWLKVVRRASTYEGGGRFKPWLMTIARHEVVNLVRKRIPAADLEPGEEIPSEEDLELDFLEASEAADLKAAVQELPDAQRLALTLWLERDASYGEIAAEMGTGEGSVRQLLYRAKQALRKRLERK